MKLLVDIGNTRVKWACLASGPIESHSFNRSKTGIKATLKTQWKDLKDISSIHVSNVAGDKIAQQLSEWTEKNWQITPTFVQSEKKRFGVTNSYAQAELLGVDRWLTLVAARQHARQATCIIDCGTAITVDIITKYGAHQGGMILPGLSLMREALCKNTSDLNNTAEDKDFKTLAVNTQSAIQAGTLYSVTATLDRIIDDLREQFNNRIRFIITGGDAEMLKPLLPSSVAHYPDIVLKGLAYYARQGDRKPRPAAKENDQDNTTDLVESEKMPATSEKTGVSDTVTVAIETTETAQTASSSDVEEQTASSDVVEQTASSDVVEQTASSGVVQQTAPSDVVEQTASSDVVQQTASSDVVQQTASSDVVQQTASSDVVQQTASSDVVEQTASSDVVEQTASSDVVEQTASSDVEEQTASSDVVEQTASSDVVEQTASSDVVEQTASSDVVEQTTVATKTEQTQAAEKTESIET